MKPLRVSWSAIRAHGECKMKSKLLRAGKRTKAVNLRMYFHGMVVDSVMRDWLANPDRSAGDMVAMVDDYIAKTQQEAVDNGDGVVRWRSADDRTELRKFCTELVTKLEPILHEHVLPYPHSCGKRFVVPIRIPDLNGNPVEIHLNGEMDLLVENDGPVVWDLKGTRDDQYYRKVLGQLVFYDLAVLATGNRPTRVVGLIQPMCTEPVLTFSLSSEDRRQMLARVIRFCHDTWRDEHPCKDGTAGCNWCDVRHACPRYQPDDLMALGAGLRLSAVNQGATQ